MSRPPISAIVIAKDEAATIDRCLASLAWAEEIVVVVDAATRDDTAERARRYTPAVVEAPWQGFVGQKLLALSHTSHDWVLWLDADEAIPAALAEDIQAASFKRFSAFELARRHWFVDRWLSYGGTFPDWNVRLFMKSVATFSAVAVHEALAVSGSVGRLPTPLEHYSTPTLSARIQKIDRYSAPDEDAPLGRPTLLRSLTLAPVQRFLLVYVRRQGFRDGRAGLVWAVCCAFESFLEAAKRWEAVAAADAERPQGRAATTTKAESCRLDRP